jgi:diguanylate cyclase (GGDEF)-like protein
VNEEHGHQVGDEVLRAVGRALRSSVRIYDTVARYGGDEFAVIAIDAGEDAAAEVMTRALDAIGDAMAELGVGSRATAGVAEWVAGESSTMLIARADRSLLEGKHREGKGRVVRASGGG